MARGTSHRLEFSASLSGSAQLGNPSISLSRMKQLVAFLSVICFFNSLLGKFVFDDHEVIETNRDVRPSTPLSSVFRNDFWGEPLRSNTSHKSYRPATIITFRWNFFLHGLNPLGYHVINVLLHTAVSVLFVSTCDVIFKGVTSSDAATLLAGVLFAVHPIHTEAVANVTGRADVQCGLFYLLSFLSYTKCLQTRTHSARTHSSPQGSIRTHPPLHGSIRTPPNGSIRVRPPPHGNTRTHPPSHGSTQAPPNGSIRAPPHENSRAHPPLHGSTRPVTYSKAWLAACLVCCVLALLSKEQGITVLAVCVVYDVICVCNVTMETVKELVFSADRPTNVHKRSWPKWLKSILERLIVLLLFCVMLLYVRIVTIGGGLPSAFVESDNPTYFHPDVWTRLRTYAYIIALNAWLLICPSKLCYDWSMDSIPRIETLWDVRNLATGCFVVVMGILVYKALRLYHATSDVTTHAQEGPHMNGNPCDVNRNVSMATYTSNHTKLPDVASQGKLLSVQSTYGRAALLGLSMTIIPFLPASNLFVPVGFVIAERVLYIPSMGYCILVSLWIRAACGTHRVTGSSGEEPAVLMNGSVSSKSTKQSGISEPTEQETSDLSFGLSGVGRVLVYMLLLVFTVKTVHRNADWYDTGSLAAAGLKFNPGNAKIHLTMGNDLAHKGFRICEKYYREALRLRPRYVMGWVNLGLVLVNTERTKEAEKAYMTALSIKPNSGDANTNLAHLLRLSRRDVEAEYRYNKALSIRPDDPVLHFYRGHVLERLGKRKEAIESYVKTTLILPSEGRAHLALGRMLGQPLVNNRHATEKALKKATNYLQEGLRLIPNEVPPRLLLAFLLLKRGETTEAKNELFQVLTRDEQNLEAEYLLGLVLEREGRQSEAIKLYRRVLKREERHMRARAAVERLKEQGGTPGRGTS